MILVSGMRANCAGVLNGRRGTGRYGTWPRHSGFSLVELIVVMSVTMVLMGLMLPAMVGLRENAHKVICASNQRQLGYAMVLYADDHNGNLPPSVYGEPGGAKKEMMAAHRGTDHDAWEGIGWLFYKMYCNAPEIFYCPSHWGHHPFDRYENDWWFPGNQRIYTNYHYAGPKEWDSGKKRRLSNAETIVIATDGLRTKRDFNHRKGMNVLRGDGSVTWTEDMDREIILLLAGDEIPDGSDEDLYSTIWKLLGNGHRTKQ